MKKEKSILEQALLQMETIEEAVKQNSKGILSSVMKEELNDLLKEEKDEDDIDDVTDVDDINPDDEEVEDVPTDGDDDTSITDELPDDEEGDIGDLDSEPSMDDEDIDDDEVLDMTDASPEEVTKVFKAMGPEDGIIVKKDGDKLELEVDGEEYIVQLDEQESEMDSEISDENIYEIELDEEDVTEDEGEVAEGDVTEEKNEPFSKGEGENLNKKRTDKGLTQSNPAGKSGKPASGDGEPFEKGEGDNLTKKRTDKGLTNSNPAGKSGEPSSDDGDPFTNTEGEPVEDGNKVRKTVDKNATKGDQTEAVRNKTNPHGSKGPNERAGLKDAQGKPSSKKWRAGSGAANINEQIETLKKQNAEYKKALVLFKEKLNEVAVFNANLAYATRLITENSTTKQEKLDILERFDSVSTIKESHKLYGQIAKELDNRKPISETVADEISTPDKTSSSTGMLSENTVYENPQFKRMKELMGQLGGK